MGYREEPFVNPYVGSIAQLMQAPGQAQAQAAQNIGAIQGQAAQQRGQAWGQAIAGAGQIAAAVPGQIQQQHVQQQEQQIRQAQIDELKQKGGDIKALDTAYAQGTSRDAILAAVPGHLRATVQKSFADADAEAERTRKLKTDTETAEADYFGALASGVKPFLGDPQQALGAAQTALAHAKAAGYSDADGLWQQIQQHPDQLPQIVDGLIARSAKYAAIDKKPQGFTLSPNQTRFDAQGQALATAPPAAPAPITPYQQAEADAAHARDAEAARHNRVMEVKPTAGAAGVADTVSNAKEQVAGMIDGTLPPVLPGRQTKEYGEIMAEAHRQHFDLVGAVTDWNATQKHIATLNGQQQTRLQQSINSLPELLDSVDALAAQWKGGTFPALNKANLALAKQGLYGERVASVARQLDAQIADVTADLGNVYMGGNSPTDEALKLAGKSLSGDWSQKVLSDMTALARKNVTIRQNSIKNTGVAGASVANPYAPPAGAPAASGAPAAMIEAVDPSGQIHHAPAGTPLPSGWKLK